MIIKWFVKIFIGAIVYSLWAVGEASTIDLGKDIYDCSDDIIASVDLDASESGKLGMVQWIRPDGRTQEAFSFTVPNSTDRNLSMNAWISLTPAQGASIFHGFDSSLGYADFIGYWTVELKIDGKKVTKNQFTIDC